MTMSDPALQAIFSRSTDEVFIVLMKITSTQLGFEPIRLAKDQFGTVVSSGETYIGCPFEASMLSDQDENLPESVISIQNIDREIVNMVRTLISAPTITITVVLASSPNVIERGPFSLKLRDVNWNAIVVTGKIKLEDILNEPFPGESMTPDLFPGMF
jgi:hypothetical protein